MSATALIKFTQGATVGTAGQALFGVISTSVSIANNSNTGVASWQIDLLSAPNGSALSAGTLASNNNSATPAASFTPDVPGAYRVMLSVWNAINRVGVATNIDIRCFGVKDTNGFYRPAPQIWPRPLPPLASGDPTAQDDENNFGGQANGWVGNGADGLMDQRLAYPTQADAIRELGGPTALVAGTIADGKLFLRSGTQITGTVVPGALSAGTQVGNSGTFVFANSNGMSFGMSGSSQITGSYTVPSLAGLISAVNLSAGTTSSNASAFTFSNANGISFGMNGATITGSVATSLTNVNLSAGTTSNNLSAFVFSNSNNVSFGLSGSTVTATISVPAQSNQTVGLFGLGNTTQNSSTTLDARSLSLNGLGIVTVGYSNGSIQVSASQSNQTEGRYALGNTTGQSSSSTFDARTMSISGTGNVSVGYSGNALVISGAVGNQNVSAGTTSNFLSAVTFSNSNGVSFGLNGSTVTASVATSLTNINVSAGTTSNNLSAFVLSNSNNVSFGLNGSTITATITVPAQTNQTVGLFAVGNTTQNSSTTLDARTVSFNGLGIVTVGYSNGSVQISASQTAQTQSNVQGISAGTQVGRTGDIVFSNSNGISFGMSGSNTVTASYTVPSIAGLISAINVSAGTTSNNLSAITFSNSNGVSFGLNASTLTASVATSLTNINVSAGTTSNNLSAVVFSNANGVSFGLNGSTVTGSVVQSNQTEGMYAIGNTTGQSSSSTFDARTMSVSGAGAVSVGYSGNALIISAAAGGQSNQTIGLYALGNTTQNSSTTLDARTVSFNGIGGLTVGYSNGSIQLSGPPVSSLSATGALSISTNGSTVSIGVPGRAVSYLNCPDPPWMTNFSISNASLSLQHFNPRADIVATQANMLMALSGNTNSSGALTVSLGIYTMSGSTMSLASSDSRALTWTSGSATTASSQYGGISGTRYRTVGLANWSITAGDYMLGVWYRTTNDGTWRAFGYQGPSIVGAVDANETNHYLPGISASSFTTAMVGSINVTLTNYVRTGSDAAQQAGVAFLGSF